MSTNLKLIENFINNGEYQKIVWLGVHGFLIINEKKKEILMIDPWPSYSKLTINHSVKIKQLIDWLFNADKNGYKLIGIIGTHEHYDHIADIPTIINNLSHDKRVLKNGFPPLYCDRGTFEEIKKRYETTFGLSIGREGPCTFEELSLYNKILLNNTKLYYNDEIQRQKYGQEDYPLIAGTRLTDIPIDNYLITPYIWDHVSTSPYFDDLKGDPSGNYQRCTAIFINQKNEDDRDKSLFIIGSAGEMSSKRTGGFVHSFGDKIETDMLIQAVPHEIVTTSNYEDILKDLVNYHEKNIKVKDMIIASHFETFVDIEVPFELIGFLVIFFGALIPFVPLGPVTGAVLAGVGDVEKNISCFYGDLEKEENKKRVRNYADLLLPNLQFKPDNKIIEIYYMNRFLIEYGFIIIEEKDDGYLVHDESILEHTNSPDPIDQIWNTEFDIFAIQGNSILLFKDRYLANPRTKEVHDLKRGFTIYNNNAIYYQVPGFRCQIHLMNFREMKHFKTSEEAFKKIEGVKFYNGCSSCMPEKDTDGI